MPGVKELQESILYTRAKVVKCTHTHKHTYHNGLLEQCKTGSIITVKIFGTFHWRPKKE